MRTIEIKALNIKEPSELLVLITIVCLNLEKDAFVVAVIKNTLLEELPHSLIPSFTGIRDPLSFGLPGDVWRSDQSIPTDSRSIDARRPTGRSFQESFPRPGTEWR